MTRLDDSPVPDYAHLTGDFDVDTVKDLVVLARGSDTVTVLLGARDAQPRWRYAQWFPGRQLTGVGVGDFNEDGADDIVVADG